MRNTIGKLALAALGVSMICAVAFAGSSGRRRVPGAVAAPMDFLAAKKARYLYEGTYSLGPVIARHEKVDRVQVSGRRIGKRPTIGLRFNYRINYFRVPRPFRFTLLTYERADHLGLRTVGMQLVGYPLERLSQPYWDLKAPLSKGRSWSFVCKYPLPPHYKVKGRVETRFVSTVKAVGKTYRLGSSTLTGCIEVVESGTTTKMFPVTCQGGQTKTVRARVINTRLWCPGHLSVRDHAEHAVLDAKGRVDSCFPRQRGATKLVAVKKLP